MKQIILSTILGFSILNFAYALDMDKTNSNQMKSDSKTDMRMEMRSEMKQACQNDLQKYCKDVTAGGGRMMACLKAHDDKLSSACKQQWDAAKAEFHKTMKEIHTACAQDVQKYCSNMDNPKDVASCLNDHSTDLSTTCKNFRASHPMMNSNTSTSTG